MITLYVGVGSAIGGMARYLLGSFIQQRSGLDFPLGTLLINITGSFLLGFLLRGALSSAAISPERRALLTTGFCGGYTTFSTFSYDSFGLIENGEYRRAILYILLTLVVSLVATFAGVAVAESLLSLRS
jgi:CrcB protein